MAKKQIFKVRLEKFPKMDAIYFVVPFNAEEVFGTKALLRVRGQINKVSYRSSIFPQGDGTHYMVVNREIRQKLKKDDGDTVTISMQPDLAERFVVLPKSFRHVLTKNKTAKKFFEALSYTHQKEYARWIEDAKKPEICKVRLEKVVPMLLKKIKTPV